MTDPQTSPNPVVETPAAQPAPENSDQTPNAQPQVAEAPRIGSLYVADLAPTVTESTLYEFFRKNGNYAIASIRVCRDSQTGKSLGYAYVNFHRIPDAQHAIDMLNFEPIGTEPDARPCRISWSRRDPSIRKSGVGNIFIKNLSTDIDHLALHDTFSNFGSILSCKVATDSAGKSKGFGFVHFSSQEEADKAINSLHEKIINGKQVFVGRFVARHLRPSQGNPEEFTNIYLKHIAPSVTQETFVEFVTKATEDIGKITSPKLMTKTEGDKEVSLEYGFVNFENHEVAKKALERFKDDAKMKELIPDMIAEGQSLYANPARQKRRMSEQPRKLVNLYVKNIAERVTEEELSELFKPYGTITSLVIMKDDVTKVPKGFGFVCYEKEDEAQSALSAMNNRLLEGKPLFVAHAQPKSLRRQILARQHATRMMAPQMMPYGMYPGFRIPAGRGFPQSAPRRNFPARQANFAAPMMGRPYPMAAPQPTVPSLQSPGVQSPSSQPSSDDFENFAKGLPEQDRMQHLGDYLYKKVVEEEADEFISKRIVGTILGSTQQLPIDKSTEYILGLIKNDANRKHAIQQAKAAFSQMSAKQQA